MGRVTVLVVMVLAVTVLVVMADLGEDLAAEAEVAAREAGAASVGPG